MPSCDMCGTESKLLIAEVEGTELQVCQNCSKYGKVIKKAKPRVNHKRHNFKRPSGPRIIQQIKSDFSKIIRDKRESQGLKQMEMAKKLSEKESLLQKIETGQITPSIDLARKLERVLGVELVEQKELVSLGGLKAKSQNLTIGDMIKFKQ